MVGFWKWKFLPVSELTHEFELVRWLDDKQLFGHFALICVFFSPFSVGPGEGDPVGSCLAFCSFPTGNGLNLVLLRGPSAGLKTFLFRTDR